MVSVRVRAAVCHAVALAALQGAAPGPAAAQEAARLLTPPPPVIHPWQVPAPPGSARAYFNNLNNGDKIETPFLLKFGLSGGWGLAPIAVPVGGKSGHHHLLVNRELPLDFQKPLPFNEQYIHFGKGQMETVLNLPPGAYTLRLLLADHAHLPHFVYSKPISITVTGKTAADPKTLAKKGVSLGLQPGMQKAPFRVQFHASGLNVGHLAQKEKDTGHFKLTMAPQPKGLPVEMEFSNGQTEVWLAPPAGDYVLTLTLVDNLNTGSTLAEPVMASIKVP